MFLAVQGGNFSIEFASGVGHLSSDLELAITGMNCNTGGGTGASTGTVNCSDFAATFTPGFAWSRHGRTSAGVQDMQLAGHGPVPPNPALHHPAPPCTTLHHPAPPCTGVWFFCSKLGGVGGGRRDVFARELGNPGRACA